MSEATGPGREGSRPYDPRDVEERWGRYWLEEGVFEANVRPDRPPFCIVIPPPNVTGALHMGHALQDTVMDLLTRWHRMRGFEALWLPGCDHAGIATQIVAERRLLQEQGLTRHDLGRQRFVDWVWKVKEDHHGAITAQLRRLGAGVDWRRERFTLDEGLSRAVREAFCSMYERGLIYQGARMVSWCPRCRTSLSDLEVEQRPEQSHFWYIRYPLAASGEGPNGAGAPSGPGPDAPHAAPPNGPGLGGVVVATTRPETMLGDTGVAVHPEDERYRHLLGRSVVLPLMQREIPVVADEHVDPAVGTGALKVTPGHDPHDLEIGHRHHLPSVVVIGPDGNMTEEAGRYAGLERFECRRRVVADLEAEGLLVKVEPYAHEIPTCDRCGTIIEPLVSEQWWVHMEPLAGPGLDAVRSGAVRFVPERWTKVYTDWLENVRDWCISRQLWWGHQIPVWTCINCHDQRAYREDPEACPVCGGPLVQEEDVLDTWFSSGLWPFSTLGWPDDTPELHYFFPTSVLVTAYDIIFFWVARMITMAADLMRDRPFAEVFIHGLILDEKGEKMSKIKDNVVDPMELIAEYGSDATRFALASMITHGQDMRLDRSRVEESGSEARWDYPKIRGARNFCNKLWQASGLVLRALEGAETAPLPAPGSPQLNLADRWILSRLHAALETVGRSFGSYDIAVATAALYQHVWNEFCDWYLEFAKPAIYDESSPRRPVVLAVLRDVLSALVRAIHPVMPFITEDIWQRLSDGTGSIAVQPFPETDPARRDLEAERLMASVMSVGACVGQARADLGVPTRQPVPVVVIAQDDELAGALAGLSVELSAHGHLASLQVTTDRAQRPARAAAALGEGVEVFVPAEGLVDAVAELERLRKRLAKAEGDRDRVAGKLANEQFASRAPADVVAKERERLAEAETELGKLGERIALFEGLAKG